MFIRNPKFILITFLTIISFPFNLNSQNFERYRTRIPFNDSQGQILNTFSGGYNNLETQFIDIDGDGDLDIMYLDSDKTYGWYENTGDKFSPNYVLSFDTIPGLKFSDWFYFIDIDDDNDFDLFTGGAFALIEFRRNTGAVSNPTFELEIDTLYDDQNNPIFSEFGCNPVFIDIDDDGDFDFLSGNSIGTVTFFENIDNKLSFNFRFITNFWQKISIIGGALKSEPANKNLETSLHGASSLDFADIDNDNDYDLFWGDLFGRSIYFIQNNGTAAVAAMDTPYTYAAYPQNDDSIWTSGFNMSRLVDIDNDNDLDLFVSVLYDPTVPQSLMFYRNQGDSIHPDFRLENENFLKTLDVGYQSSQFFVDIDNDGDKDLFTGSTKSSKGTLHFFVNTGTLHNPSFVLVDSNYSEIEGDLALSPSFCDLDGDDDFDLIIGESFGFNGSFSLYMNKGTKFQPDFVFNDKLKDSSGILIIVSDNAHIFPIDFDIDGDVDLITGGSNGQIRLYRNIGTASNYNFVFDSSHFKLDVGNYSSPFLIDYDEDGDYDLFTGSSEKIFYYTNDGDNLNPAWNLVTDKFLNQTFGGYATPFFIDLDNDTDNDLLIGNVKGGFYYFENTTITGIVSEEIQPDDFNLRAFPNPFNNQVQITINLFKSEEITVSIFNVLGQKLSQLFKGFMFLGKNQLTWDGKNDKKKSLPSGNYFVVAETFDNLKTIKLILLK